MGRGMDVVTMAVRGRVMVVVAPAGEEPTLTCWGIVLPDAYEPASDHAQQERGEQEPGEDARTRVEGCGSVQLALRTAQGGEESRGILQAHGQPPHTDGQPERTSAHRGIDRERDDAGEGAVHDPAPAEHGVDA